MVEADRVLSLYVGQVLGPLAQVFRWSEVCWESLGSVLSLLTRSE